MGVTDHMVCFALYSATRAATRAYRTLLAPWGLTYPQYLLLVILWNEGDRTVRELGETMQLDSGTLSPLIRRLEKSDYVVRIRGGEDGSDGRVVTVALTQRGADLRAELADIPSQIAETMGLSNDAEAASLIRSLTRLCDAAETTAHTSTNSSSTTEGTIR